MSNVRSARRTGLRRVCVNCSVSNQFPASGAYAASRWRRLGGALLEILLIVLTLVVGLADWLWLTAKTSQSPAKRLLDMYILSMDSTPATAERVWLREVGVKLLLFGVAGWVTEGISNLLDAIWIFRGRDRQTLHDKVAGTLVVHARTAVAAAAGSAPADGARGVDAYRTDGGLGLRGTGRGAERIGAVASGRADHVAAVRRTAAADSGTGAGQGPGELRQRSPGAAAETPSPGTRSRGSFVAA